MQLDVPRFHQCYVLFQLQYHIIKIPILLNAKLAGQTQQKNINQARSVLRQFLISALATTM